MPELTRLNRQASCSRSGTAATELAIIMPVFLLMVLGCIDCGRFVNTSIAVTNAARAGAGVGIMSRYPDPRPECQYRSVQLASEHLHGRGE